MTEPFRVPENLIATVGVGFEKRLVVNASDLPALCHAEVERAFKEMFGETRWPLAEKYLASRFPEAAPEPTCTHQAYTVNWAGRFEGSIVCDGCGLTGTAKRLRPSHDSDFSIHWVTPQPSAEPQMVDGFDIAPPVRAVDLTTGKCVRCQEVVTDPRTHECVTPSAGERCSVEDVIRMACVAAREAFPRSATDGADDDFEHRLREKVRARVPTPTEGERQTYIADWGPALEWQAEMLAREKHRVPTEGERDDSCLVCGSTEECGHTWNDLPSEQGHPMQELVVAKDGCIRFKANPLVRWLLDNGGKTMNDLALVECTDADRMQFAQLIGYSLSGYGELSYVTDASYYEAERRAKPLEPVPTPTAGEEDAFVTEFPCTQCGHTFRTAEGYTTHNCPPVGVSAGETKCGKLDFYGTSSCTKPVGHDGYHRRDNDHAWPDSESLPAEPAVGARPEERRKPGLMGMWLDQNTGHLHNVQFITPAERAFVRALAKQWAELSLVAATEPSHPVVAAARRVVEESARRVTA